MRSYEEERESVVRMLGPVREMPILKLDPEALGDRLIRLVAISASLGHAQPVNTLCYVDRNSSAEVSFMRDVLELSTEQIVDNWFGGTEGAARFAGTNAASAFADVTALAAAALQRQSQPAT